MYKMDMPNGRFPKEETCCGGVGVGMGMGVGVGVGGGYTGVERDVDYIPPN